MRNLLVPTLLALSLLACDSANPVAPTGSVLTVVANPSQIALDGASTLTVSGFRPDGNPLYPGTQIQLTTTIGTLAESLVEAGDDGRATVVLQGDGRTGTATVTATLAASETSATVDVLIGESEETKPVLLLSASPGSIGLEETSIITVQARNPDGSPYAAGGQITIRTSLGSLRSGSLVTDGSGNASTILDAGDQPGSAEITATLGASDEASVTVTIENRRPVLLINANPDSVPVGGTSTVTVIARDNNGTPLGAGHRIQMLATLGSIPDFAVTDASGRAEATYQAGSESGTATIRAFLGASEVVSTTIDIRDSAADISLTANPSSINFGDATIRLTATVRNAVNDGIPSINVLFVAEIGTLETTGGAPSAGTVRTNTQGEAELVLQVAQDDIGARQSFQVFASVVTETGTLDADPVTITISGN